MKNNEVDPRLIEILGELKEYPARDPKKAVWGRARFLAQAVSAPEEQRHSLWTLFQRKDSFAMKLIASTLVIVGLLFGGNATVAAAQNDLPNEPLYQIKLMSEDVNLWFVADPVQEIEMLMQQAQTRIEEMQRMASSGVTPPAGIAIRARERIQRALQLAAGLDQPTQEAILQKIQTRLQTQEQQMSQFQAGTCAACEPVLQQTREMLRLQLREVQNGLGTPAPAQNQNQNQIQNQNQARATQTPPAVNTPIGAQGTCTPVMDGSGQQNGSGSPAAGTPQQQNQQQNKQKENQQNGSGSGNENNQGPGSGGDQGGQGGQGGKP